MNQGICLATNYLTMTEPSRRMWTDFDRHLETHGLRLVLLTSALPEEPPPFPIIPIPFLLRDYPQAFPGALAAMPEASGWPTDSTLLEADCIRGCGMHSPADAAAGLRACRGLINTVLRTLQPNFALTWDPTSPLAQVLQAACRADGRPVLGMERGLLPDTLMVDSHGIQGRSDVRTHWLAEEMRHAKANEAAYETIRSYYRKFRPQKYAQPDAVGGSALRAKLGLQGKKIVVFLGHYDACGLAPKGSNEQRYNSPAFASTNEALLAVWAAVEKTPGAALVFKPHPIDRDPYAVARVEGVHLLRDAHVQDLIEMADVVAAQFTTLQYEAALHDKPVLLLARSAWSGWDATYEVLRRTDVPSQLQAALAGTGWAARRANARRFLTQIMERYLVGCTPEVPTRRRLPELASFIARTALDDAHQPPREDRFAQLLQALETLQPAPSAPPSTSPAPELLPVSA